MKEFVGLCNNVKEFVRNLEILRVLKNFKNVQKVARICKNCMFTSIYKEFTRICKNLWVHKN